jgi:hypothetical protein
MTLFLLAEPLTAPVPVATSSTGEEDEDLVVRTDTRIPLPQELHIAAGFSQMVPPVILSVKAAGVAPGTDRLGVLARCRWVAWLDDEGIDVDITVK